MEKKGLFHRFSSPIGQALLVYAVAAVFITGGWLFDKMGVVQGDPLFAWSTATAFLLLYAVFNSVMSLSSDHALRYWRDSMYSYLGLAALNALTAWGVTGLSLGEAGSYKWIYVVVTFSFLVFLSMVNLMKRIVQFAEREEWSQPRKRRR